MWKPNEEEKDRLRKLYASCTLTVDRLPHTTEFEELHEAFGADVSKNQLFLALANMRKRKELPRKPR